MRFLAVAGGLVALALLVIAAPSRTSAGRTAPERRWERAHEAAVRYRSERDHLQRLLVGRVREARALRRSLVHRPSSLEALRLAAVAYGVPFGLEYRIASCESTGSDPDRGPVSERSLYAHAANPASTAKGLGQFLDSSWAATPYAGFDVFSPYASALAIAHEIRLGHLWQWSASRGCWQ